MDIHTRVFFKDMKSLVILMVGVWLSRHSVDGAFVGDSDDIFGQSPPNKPFYPFDRQAIMRISKAESDIYKYLSTYTEHLENHLNILKRYMVDYEDSSVNKIIETEDEDFNDEWRFHMQIANPFLFHRLIRRYAIDFKEIVSSFKTLYEADLLGFLHHMNDQVNGFPNAKDCKESLNALLRIQKYSDFDALEFSNGIKILGGGDQESFIVGLTDRDAIELGKRALDINELAVGVEWLEVAKKKLNPVFTTAKTEFELNTSLKRLIKMHDITWNEMNGTLNSLFSSKINKNFGQNCPRREKVIDVEKQLSKLHRKETNYSNHMRNNFINLCSGYQLQTEEEKSRLYCFYDNKKHPYLQLNPLKTEMLNESPPLIQIYDIISRTEIKKFISKAYPNLKRSRVINRKDPTTNDVSPVRTSVQTWLYERNTKDYEWLVRVTTKIEMATQLNVKGPNVSESYQVASYGTSHHYDEHIDALNDTRWTENNGDRIATFMIYLTDVEAGGLTAFPVLGTAATPIKGSAVFWNNLLDNGDPDPRAWHGGCPIVHGIKWVANKWILSNGNWNKRKCTSPNQKQVNIHLIS